MALQLYNPAVADEQYKNFYGQTGGSMVPIFHGTKYQRGHGLGSIFSGLFKAAVPMLKKGAVQLGKTALKTGVNIAKDALGGESIKSAFSKNVKSAGRDILNKSFNSIGNLIDTPTSQSSNITRKRNRPTLSTKQRSGSKRSKTQSRDIFS